MTSVSAIELEPVQFPFLDRYGPRLDRTGLGSFLDWRRSVCCVSDKQCTRRRAVEGRTTVWQITKCCACMLQPLLSVGLIVQQRCGSVWWGGWAGHEPTTRTNCGPPPPTGRTKAAHSLSIGTTAAVAQIRQRSKGATNASVHSDVGSAH